MRRHFLPVLLIVVLYAGCARPDTPPVTMKPMMHPWDPILDTVQSNTIRFFLETTDSTTGLAVDRYPKESPASIASVGFALTVYPIAVERKIISREEASRRTLNTLRYFWSRKQSQERESVSGFKGFYYHFLTMKDGTREWNCELSTIDTGLLMSGVLFAQSYFDGRTPIEADIRATADSLYRRVDWTWASDGMDGVAFHWSPEHGFSNDAWHGYCESMIMYVLAFGSPTHPAGTKGWEHWTSTYVWDTFYGLDFVQFGPLFGHQYSHCWIDFNGIKDAYMSQKGIDYFENSRRATYSQQAYAVQNPGGWKDYSATLWGLTACDGPGGTVTMADGKEKKFEWYNARGAASDWNADDGTIAPTAVVSSIPFAPEICVPTVVSMFKRYGRDAFNRYGFVDAFNPSFIGGKTPRGWFDSDRLGIDQGPIAIMIENYRNGFVWEVMKRNPYIREGLRKAGFKGGWIAQ
jgi:hypothetical protein